MQNKPFLFFFLLLVCGIFVSCSKPHNDTPVTPVPPPVEIPDTLGQGWQRIKIDSLALEDVFFTSNQVGYLCGNRYLAKSTDGGSTWKTILPDSLLDYFAKIFFVDANHGWVTGLNGLLSTSDAGNTWKKVYKEAFFNVQFFDAKTGYGTSTQKGLLKTTDGGLTFKVADSISAYGIFFLSQDTGWFGLTSLYKTENAGLSYSKNALSIGQFYAIQFADNKQGWLAGFPGVSRTVDGGKSVQQLIATTVTFQGADIYFFNNHDGYLLGNGKIYSTNDGGTTLTQVCTVHHSTLYEIYFTDPSHGWATGGGGYVYKFVKP